MTEILLVAEATSCVFLPLDRGVERFTAGIRNLMSQVGDDIAGSSFLTSQLFASSVLTDLAPASSTTIEMFAGGPERWTHHMDPREVVPSLHAWITITDRERISGWGRTRLSREVFSRQKWYPSWRCHRSADCTTVTNDGSPEAFSP